MSEGADERTPEFIEEMNSKYGFNLQPRTPKYARIKEALQTLLDPELPYEHIEGNHNCGECWECIYGTITIARLFMKEKLDRDHQTV